jgi:hypothetical protein
MSKLNSLKANEKLPRGSYFYIKVGHRFYSGEMAETIEVSILPDRQPYDPRRGSSYNSVRRYGRQHARHERKGTLASYRKPLARPENVIEKQYTGRRLPQLVDDQNQAKQFRKKESVLNACNRLKSLYSDLDVKVTIEYEEGDTK